LVITTGVLVVNVAQADTNAFSVGYAQSKVQDFKNIRGVNVKYVAILERCGKTFENPVFWGVDLSSEHERYLAEEHFKAPVVVKN
ncbi:hypothetical protein MJM43_31620, partial [Salmonella enterica subsp. enterica serovar Montevideo]|nr:hypothetical protein [Salmonella enterica subsp. enterica serovar Montevideo]